MKTQKLIPCLWFDESAEEAVEFYTSIFKNSNARPKGDVQTEIFELEGQEFMALNGGSEVQFSHAISFFVACETEQEIDTLWGHLSKDGKVPMVLQKYPFAEKYGWCEDRFGVSWQLMLAKRTQKICPALLFTGKQAGKAHTAIEFYTSLFSDSKIEAIARDEKTNVILHARFTLAGQDFVAMESPMNHEFEFSPAISFAINCENQAEIDGFWKTLPAEKDAEQCGWLTDPFGISWQIVSVAP